MFSNITEIESLISRLIDKLDASKTDIIELEVADVKIKLGKHSMPPHHESHQPPSIHIPHGNAAPIAAMSESAKAVVEPSTPVSDIHNTVNAPLLGVAYAAPSPDSSPFVKIGDKIKKGDIICIIEAMKVMNEIESDKDGEITEILFENGNMVEYGQPLIAVK